LGGIAKSFAENSDRLAKLALIDIASVAHFNAGSKQKQTNPGHGRLSRLLSIALPKDVAILGGL
jgi:hypothetical protein